MRVIDRIVPVPQSYTLSCGADLYLGRPGEANYRIEANLPDCDPLYASAVSELKDKLGKLLGVCPCTADGDVVIRLCVGEAPAEAVNADQGYKLVVADNAITVTGFGAAGLYYGVVTLCQMLVIEDNVLTLPAMEIVDWPELRTRGHFMESRYGSNTMTLDDWKHVVDHMAAMKMNQLVVAVYGCWCVQYDHRVSEYLYVPIKKYPQLKTPVVKRYYSPEKQGWVDEEALPPMFEQDFFGDLIAYGKTRGVTVFPLFNSYGHNTLIPAAFPEISSKDENGEPFLTGLCTKTERTYEILFDIYDEIIDRYLIPNGIDSFHIGLDEVWTGLAQNADDIFRRRSDFCLCEKCRDIPKHELYIEHAIKLLSHLRDRGMKHIYMYHDMLIKKPHHGDFDATEMMMHALQEANLTDVVVIDWWTYSDYQESLMFQSTKPEQGLRRTVKPWNGYYHWNVISHPLKNVYLLGKMAKEEGCEGMQSYSAWDESYDRTHVAQAEYAWNFNGSGSVREVSDKYVRARFGAEYALAKRATDLFDDIMSTERIKDWDGELMTSNHSLLMSTLAYYFYSYVREGKPYPRNFPGEAISNVLDKRSVYEPQMISIAAMAREAGALWTEVAKNPAVDQRMARRYIWESSHYECLAEDYLAILRMVDLVNADGTVCPCSIGKIRALAQSRRDARLDLMANFELTKEFFLRASHMRNHSIFMQFFADLDGYLAATPAEEVKLDFTDLSGIASPMFWKLR